MRLNDDCCRDILLLLEETPQGKPLLLDDMMQVFPQYTKIEIYESAKDIHDRGFCKSGKGADPVAPDFIPPAYYLLSITPRGRDYANTIRPPTNFEKLKRASAEMGKGVFDFMREVTKEVLVTIIASKVQ